jgi:hypothetical protein
VAGDDHGDEQQLEIVEIRDPLAARLQGGLLEVGARLQDDVGRAQ